MSTLFEYDYSQCVEDRGALAIEVAGCLKAWPHASHFIAALHAIRHQTNPPRDVTRYL
jgi:hypothetical protein